MPYKPYGRDNYAVWRTLDGFGRVGPFSTCQARLKLAQQMEEMWVSLPRLGYSDLIQAVIDDRTTLPEIWTSYVNDGLADMRARLSGAKNETIAAAVAEFLPYTTDERIQAGLAELTKDFGTQPFTFMTTSAGVRVVVGKALAKVVRTTEAGEEVKRAPNSVRRSLWRAVNDILVHRLGRAERARILADVKAPGKTRLLDRNLTPDQIKKLIEACDDEFRPMALLALLTGVDRKPLLNLQVKHFNETEGTLWVPDTKAESRPRVLDLSQIVLALGSLRVACSGRGPEERLFPFTIGQVTSRWRTARMAVGLPWLRFKDLRHVFATKWLEGGGDIRTLQQWLGHSTYYTTMVYVGTVKRTGAEPAANAVAQMGLGGPILKIERVS